MACLHASDSAQLQTRLGGGTLRKGGVDRLERAQTVPPWASCCHSRPVLLSGGQLHMKRWAYFTYLKGPYSAFVYERGSRGNLTTDSQKLSMLFTTVRNPSRSTGLVM